MATSCWKLFFNFCTCLLVLYFSQSIGKVRNYCKSFVIHEHKRKVTALATFKIRNVSILENGMRLKFILTWSFNDYSTKFHILAT